jgi:hypothetical protein
MARGERKTHKKKRQKTCNLKIDLVIYAKRAV